MAIRKISILNNDGTWAEAEAIGADANDITLKYVTDQGLAVNETIASVKILSTDTGTAAWNKYNKMCDAVVRLDSHFDSAVSAMSSTFDAHIGQMSQTFTSQINTLSTAFDTAMTNLSNAFSSTTSDLTGVVDAALPQTKTITISSEAWASSAYTHNDAFFQSTSYVYWISPLGLNYEGVYAEDIVEAGKITFKCLTTPENFVTINVIRMKDGTPSE